MWNKSKGTSTSPSQFGCRVHLMQIFQLSMCFALWLISPSNLKKKHKLNSFWIKSVKRCIPATTERLVPRTKELIKSKTLEAHADQTSGCCTESSPLQFARPANGDAGKASKYRPRILWRASSRWQSADSSDSKEWAGGATSGRGLKDKNLERKAVQKKKNQPQNSQTLFEL